MSKMYLLTQAGADMVGGEVGGRIVPSDHHKDSNFCGPDELPFNVESEGNVGSSDLNHTVFLNKTHYEIVEDSEAISKFLTPTRNVILEIAKASPGLSASIIYEKTNVALGADEEGNEYYGDVKAGVYIGEDRYPDRGLSIGFKNGKVICQTTIEGQEVLTETYSESDWVKGMTWGLRWVIEGQ